MPLVIQAHDCHLKKINNKLHNVTLYLKPTIVFLVYRYNPPQEDYILALLNKIQGSSLPKVT